MKFLYCRKNIVPGLEQVHSEIKVFTCEWMYNCVKGRVHSEIWGIDLTQDGSLLMSHKEQLALPFPVLGFYFVNHRLPPWPKRKRKCTVPAAMCHDALHLLLDQRRKVNARNSAQVFHYVFYYLVGVFTTMIKIQLIYLPESWGKLVI